MDTIQDTCITELVSGFIKSSNAFCMSFSFLLRASAANSFSYLKNQLSFSLNDNFKDAHTVHNINYTSVDKSFVMDHDVVVCQTI